MDLLPNDLTSASLRARDRLDEAARRTAVPPPAGAKGGMGTAMAAAAQAAIFADALLGALKARLEELRAAAR